VVIALGLGFGLAVMGLDGIDLPSALLYGSAHAAVGLVFAGIAAITVQVTAHARGAIGLGLAIAGLAYILRAAGDAGTSDTLSWISPVGWAQRTYPFVDDTWWPLLLSLGLAVLTAWIGFALSTRRDVGAGLAATRQGRAHASRALTSPLGLAIRLHRGMIIGFSIGVFILGAMYGSILSSVQDMLSGVEQLDQAVESIGGASLVESFAALIMVVLALIASCFVAIAAMKPKAEAGSGRAEPLLSTGLSRAGWVGSHAIVAAGGGTLMLILAGLGFGLTGAASTSDGDLVWKLTLAGLVYAPALWVVLGVAVVLYGWLPRFTAAIWILVVYGFFAGYFGRILQLPDWMNDLSPFGHVPQLPAADMEWTPLVVLTLIAIALFAFGLAGFRRRDLELK
jgi:ABC-2 type transport system permease protein